MGVGRRINGVGTEKMNGAEKGTGVGVAIDVGG